MELIAEVQHLCLKAYSSTTCPVKQAEVLQRRLWLKNKILKIFDEYERSNKALANVGWVSKEQGKDVDIPY